MSKHLFQTLDADRMQPRHYPVTSASRSILTETPTRLGAAGPGSRSTRVKRVRVAKSSAKPSARKPRLTQTIPAPLPTDTAPEAALPVPSETAVEAVSTPGTSRSCINACALTLYLQEIGRVPLLSAAEQMALAKRVCQGDKAARDLMIKSNLRLVVKIARDFEYCGVPLLDLISEGNIGLMRAVDRFDPHRGVKLSSYAALWIKQAIRRALCNQSRVVRLPVHVHEKLARFQFSVMRLTEILGHEPTDEEIGQDIGLSVRQIRRLRLAIRSFVSLEQSFDDTHRGGLGEMLADPQVKPPDETLDQVNSIQILESLLKDLNVRERLVLERRFGLLTDEEDTLNDLGLELGLTRERIRQIQNQALAKLRKKFKKLNTAQSQ